MPDRRVSPIAASGLPVRFWLLKVRSSTLSSRNILEQPKYPPEARRARVEGVVILEATVTAEGTVDKVKVISGPPMLTAAAVEALTHWKYEPTYLNGQAVPVIPTARISFSLSGTPR